MWYWPPAPVGYRNTWQTSVKGWFCFVIPYKSEILDALGNCCSYTNIQTVWFYHAVMLPKDAHGMTDSVDVDQSLLYTVCADLSVWQLGIITITWMKYKMSHCMAKPTNWPVRPARTQISLGIFPVWSETSLYAQWVAKDPMFLHADSEDSDQTGWMPRLIWVFAGHTSFCWFGHAVAHIIVEEIKSHIENRKENFCSTVFLQFKYFYQYNTFKWSDSYKKGTYHSEDSDGPACWH